MEIVRQPEVVEAYHFDLRNGQELATEIKVGINPLENTEPDFPADTNSLLGLRVEFRLVFEEIILSGSIRQMIQTVDRKIERPEDCTKEEVDEFVRPLFSIIERLTYEVTEIALDQPGIQLNFETTP